MQNFVKKLHRDGTFQKPTVERHLPDSSGDPRFWTTFEQANVPYCSWTCLEAAREWGPEIPKTKGVPYRFCSKITDFEGFGGFGAGWGPVSGPLLKKYALKERH